MSHKRKDTLAKTREWAKHLRPFEKRKQSHRERRAAIEDIHKQNTEATQDDAIQE